ncbi:uncharacterized protein LOC110808453 isoform X2 [Carica papaya]|uniref:uncharacterized protein LOC110808453 isoform X2 n=1 Tax=Carica papaya TaxID=3649 RepID=UPI000B8CEC78|nr:uncharacterized protein LOC110808453 isoform X2 [Carica papaya]
MGKRSSQRRSAAMLDSEDDNSSVSSCTSMRSDNVLATEEVQLDKDTLLDQAVDALYEKRASTREKALSFIIEAFSNNVQHQFVEKKFATLLHQCLNSIKRGSSTEISLASHAIGLLALTVGPGDNAHEILEESVTPITQSLKSGSESSKIASLLECLAIITFVGANDPEETEKSIQIIWQLVHPKQGSNVVPVKRSAAVITALVSSWAFLLTTMDEWMLSPKNWRESISYFISLLEKDDRSVRIAAGEALVLIFEICSLEKLSAQDKGSNDGSSPERNKSQEGWMHIQGLKTKFLNQVRYLSTEAGGRGSTKKDLNSQRNLFKDILEFLEDGYSPETSMKIGGESLSTSTWSQMIQLNFLKRFLGGGFVNHMQDVLGFTSKRKNIPGAEHRLSSTEKRMLRSSNSCLNKARTQLLNKQRMLVQGRNAGHFAVNMNDEEL